MDKQNTIECKVVMLPTKDNQQLTKYIPHNELVWISPPMRVETTDIDYQAQYIYFTSEDKIQENDWVYLPTHTKENVSLPPIVQVGKVFPDRQRFYSKDGNIILDHKYYVTYRKIVASTNKELCLPTIPIQWIKDSYVPLNGSIKDVKLRMTTYPLTDQQQVQEMDFDERVEYRKLAGKDILALTRDNEVIIAKYSYPIAEKEEPKIVKIEGGLPKNNHDGTFSVTPLVTVFSDGSRSDDAIRKFEKIANNYGEDISHNYPREQKKIAAIARDGYKAGWEAMEKQSIIESIEFGIWIGKEGYKASEAHEDTWISTDYIGFTTKQLYEIWKKK